MAFCLLTPEALQTTMSAKKVSKNPASKAAKKATKKAVKKTAKKAPAKKAAKKAAKAMAKRTAATAETPSHDEIARAAYFCYIDRQEKGLLGDDKTDWATALQQLTS